MRKWPVTQQSIAGTKLLYDLIVGFEDMLPFEHRCSFQVDTIATNRVIDLEVISLTNLEIFKTVCRRRVNTPCSRISGDVITQHQWYGFVRERW